MKRQREDALVRIINHVGAGHSRLARHVKLLLANHTLLARVLCSFFSAPSNLPVLNGKALSLSFMCAGLQLVSPRQTVMKSVFGLHELSVTLLRDYVYKHGKKETFDACK